MTGGGDRKVVLREGVWEKDDDNRNNVDALLQHAVLLPSPSPLPHHRLHHRLHHPRKQRDDEELVGRHAQTGYTLSLLIKALTCPKEAGGGCCGVGRKDWRSTERHGNR